MNEGQFNQAKKLRNDIADTRAALDSLPDERNHLGLPEATYNRHQQDKRDFLTGELRRLEAEFTAL